MLKICVIGYGSRINGIVKKLVSTGQVTLAGVMDVRCEEVKHLYTDPNGFENVRFYSDADEMLRTEQPDGVCIGTRCSLHTHYALLAEKYKIAVFLEKPVCTSYEDLARLKGIADASDRFVVSFPLRFTPMVTYVKELIARDTIGKVEHIQAYNNVPYARGYYHKWYRDEGETGGLFLQKATHDVDYLSYLLDGLRPIRVCAMKSKQIFKGDRPAGLRCEDCDERESCPESPENVRKTGDTRECGPWCCFATDTGNEDSGSLIIEYESGMHAVYSQNFIARFGAGKRGARLIGYKGTLEFDWLTDTVTVHHHLENSTETHKIDIERAGHFGGDLALVDNFIRVMRGEETSRATLLEGMLSAEICLAARTSSEEHRFVEIK